MIALILFEAFRACDASTRGSFQRDPGADFDPVSALISGLPNLGPFGGGDGERPGQVGGLVASDGAAEAGSTTYDEYLERQLREMVRRVVMGRRDPSIYICFFVISRNAPPFLRGGGHRVPDMRAVYGV